MKKKRQVVGMKNKALIILFIVLGICGMKEKQVVATENQNDVGFYVTPVTPATQLDLSRSFFYVKTEPEKEQILKVNVTNTTKEEKTIEINIANAMSTENGQIDFQEVLVKETSLKNSVEELITTKDKEITLKSDETKTVEFSMKPSKDHYEGVKMGAITFKNKSGEEANGMVSVYNSYKIDVVLSENGDDFRNGEVLKLKKVGPELNKGRKVIQAEIQNPESKLVRNLEIKAKLIDKKNNKEIKNIHTIDYGLAPNSVLPFIFDLGLSNIKPGEYKVKMTITNVDNQWDLEKDFKINNEQAKKLNDESPFRINTPQRVKFLSILLGISVVVIIIILIKRKNKWQKESKHRKSRRKKGKKRK